MGERDASRWAHCVTKIVVPNSSSAEGGLDTAKSPRCVGEVLRIEIVQPTAHHLSCDGTTERLRRVARLGERPRRVGEVLLFEIAQLPAHHLSCDGLEELRRQVARGGERPRRVGEVLLFEIAQLPAYHLS